MGYLISGHMSANYTPDTQPKDPAPTEHRCGNCYGQFGLSALPCQNAPGAVRARAFLATREQIRRDERES